MATRSSTGVRRGSGRRALALLLALALSAIATAAEAVAPGPAEAAAGTLRVDGLRTDDLVAPLGLDDRNPVLSWRVATTARNAKPSTVQVQAASTRARLGINRPDLWSSGRRRPDAPSLTWAGAPLTSRMAVYWRVRVFDAFGRPSPWSSTATFEMGLLTPSDWSAGWITDPGWTADKYQAVTSRPVTVSFPVTTARYLRLSVTKLGATPAGDTGHYLQLAELEAYGDEQPGVNLAARRPVTPSSTLNAYGWDSANLTDTAEVSRPDGALGWTTFPSRQSTDTTTDPAWAVIDLGAEHRVDRVVLYPRTDTLSTTGGTASFPVDYTVQVGSSPDPSGLRTVAQVTGQPTPAVPSILRPAALPVLAKQFTVGRPVVRARLHVSGVGVVIASINGRPVSDAVLEPGYTDLRRRVGYSTYDVTGLIKPGANAIGIRLGTGIASVSNDPGRYTKLTGTQSLPKAIAQLELTDARGHRQIVGTDSSWRATQGATVLSNFFGGEAYDARRELPGWDQPGTDRSGWQAAAPTTPPSPAITLSGRRSPPLRVVQKLPASLVGSPAPGVQLYDLGTNVAGWMQLRINAPAGHEVSVYPAELLTGGRIDQSSTGSPIVDTFIGDGAPHTWHPEFMYHGFRYFEVRGVTAGVTVSGATGLVIRADNDRVGSFSSSDGVLDAVHRIIDRAVQSNMFSTLTDCPHREKLGWLEETHLVFGTIMRNYDVAAYAQEIVRRISEAQLPSGLVPSIAPEYAVFSGGFRDDPNWGSAMVLLPWEMYRNYGDVQTLRTYYPNMRAYVAYLDSRATGDLVRYAGSGLGDWGEMLTGAARTDVDLVANFGYYRATNAMAGIAAAIGNTTDAAAYANKAAAIRTAFQARWYNAGRHTVANGSQAALALALDIGAVPVADRSAVFATLTAAIAANAQHLNVGEIALPSVFRVLSAFGRDDLVYTLTAQPTSPSYGYFVARGATSLPEYWDMTSSQNHFMLGAIDEWFSAHLAGIRQEDNSVAYRRLVVQPSIVGGVTHAEAAYRTPYGQVAASWVRAGWAVRMRVTVPVGSTATVYVPLFDSAAAPPTPSGAGYHGIQRLADGMSYAVFSVGAGDWSFDARRAGH